MSEEKLITFAENGGENDLMFSFDLQRFAGNAVWKNLALSSTGDVTVSGTSSIGSLKDLTYTFGLAEGYNIGTGTGKVDGKVSLFVNANGSIAGISGLDTGEVFNITGFNKAIVKALGENYDVDTYNFSTQGASYAYSLGNFKTFNAGTSFAGKNTIAGIAGLSTSQASFTSLFSSVNGGVGLGGWSFASSLYPSYELDLSGTASIVTALEF